jgi:hypothetical protein
MYGQWPWGLVPAGLPNSPPSPALLVRLPHTVPGLPACILLSVPWAIEALRTQLFPSALIDGPIIRIVQLFFTSHAHSHLLFGYKILLVEKSL